MKAIKYLVKQSPAGEVQDVLKYLGDLVGDVSLLKNSPDVMGALRKWFETHKVHIELPDGRKCMVTAEGFSGDESGAPADMFVYYDFTNQCVFKFDPVKTDQVEIVSDEPMQIADSAFRQSLVESVKDYVGKSYCKGKTLFNIQ